MDGKGVLVEDGRFRVFPDGSINRVKNGVERPAGITVFKGRGGSRRTTTYYKHGKQVCVYLSRLVAQAFIRPLKPGEVVHHIDGNTANDCASNLCILKQADVSRQSAYRSHFTRQKRYGHACARCGKLTVSHADYCPQCAAQLNYQKNHERTVAAKTQRLADSLAGIKPELLTEKENAVIALRRQGMSYGGISAELEMGVSPEWVRQIINRCILISERGYRRKAGFKQAPESFHCKQSVTELEEKIKRTERRLEHYKVWIEAARKEEQACQTSTE